MDKLIDLHIHSTYSDGDHTPEELIKIANSKNIKTISITDHDTVLAYHNLKPQDLVDIIPGIELSAKDDIGKMHILGYGIDPYNHDLIEATCVLRENNIKTLLIMIDNLKKQGIIISDEDISDLINKDGDVSRVQLAKILVNYGYSKTIREAFKQYLIEGYDEISKFANKLPYKECIELILDAGGVPVLAHPYTLKRSDKELENLVKEMIKCGLMGLEVYHSGHNLSKIANYYKLVNRYNLLYSGGTDYHGEYTKPNIEMGRGREKSLVLTRCSVLDYVKNRK